MVEKTDWIKVATKIYEGTKWSASDEDIYLLSQRLCMLECRGMSKLVKRLIEGGKKVWDTFAEMNFCYELFKHNAISTTILYEPDEVEGRKLQRPPDFVIPKEGITLWIQMKNISDPERENRHSKNIAQIKKMANSIKIAKLFWCDLSEDFSNDDVCPLIEFLSEMAEGCVERKEYRYHLSGKTKAKVSFWKPRKALIENLTLVGSGDLEWMDVTGESSTQIKGSLSNAAEAFTWDVDDKNINLIAIEVGNSIHGYIDIGEALFGTEEIVYKTNVEQRYHRLNDGFFYDLKFCNKVAGVIVMKRKEHLPICEYSKTLFINEKFQDRLDQICLIMKFEKVVHHYDLLNN